MASKVPLSYVPFCVLFVVIGTTLSDTIADRKRNVETACRLERRCRQGPVVNGALQTED